MALQENRIRDGITIVGAGTTGYLTALNISKNYPDVEVEWIYPENNKPIGVGEATVPGVTQFFQDLGIDVNVILKEINGSLKLGILFKDFYKKGESFTHPFGETDEESAELKYCIENNVVPDDILKFSEIATHFDVRELMMYLDKVMKDIPNLTIKRRTVESLDEIENKVVIDCTGFKKSLLNTIVEDNFVDITNVIPNNTALVYRAPYRNKEQKVPYTIAQAKDYGWIWHIPLGNQLSVGYVHDNSYDVKEEYISHLKDLFGEVDEERIATVPMLTGRNKEHLVQYKDKTVIALGLSSFFIEPLESTGLYLVVYGIKMLNKWIRGEVDDKEYNKIYNYEFDVILDFIVAHYKYSENNNPYWNLYKDIKLEEYRENFIFPQRSWNYILDGMKQSEFNPRPDIRRFLKLRKSEKYCDWVDTI